MNGRQAGPWHQQEHWSAVWAPCQSSRSSPIQSIIHNKYFLLSLRFHFVKETKSVMRGVIHHNSSSSSSFSSTNASSSFNDTQSSLNESSTGDGDSRVCYRYTYKLKKGAGNETYSGSTIHLNPFSYYLFVQSVHHTGIEQVDINYHGILSAACSALFGRLKCTVLFKIKKDI